MEKVDSAIQRKIVLDELYQQIYGIYDHMSNPDPLAVCSSFESEEIEKMDPTRYMLDIYRNEGIKDQYGLTVLEFLDLPTNITKMLLDSGKKDRQREHKELEELRKLTK